MRRCQCDAKGKTMVSNFERILAEIRQGAEQMQQMKGDCMPEPRTVVKLVMEIVDLEDRNRVRSITGINQKVKGMIRNATPIDNRNEDS